MAQVRVEVGGRSYSLTCKDGEEKLLQSLASHVNEKAEKLSRQLGHLPETRLLLMSAIMLADENAELAAGGKVQANKESPDAEARAAQAVLRATEKVEAAAAALEKADAST
ncbi:cell division protein ZapA [Pacificimonas sp. ICDLI1SI03]|jgi:cell division protein ZapA|tara:strand:+ start:46106 stop:46438 length:333 start_codon:yes stop_codon:yes gene_type:complete